VIITDYFQALRIQKEEDQASDLLRRWMNLRYERI